MRPPVLKAAKMMWADLVLQLPGASRRREITFVKCRAADPGIRGNQGTLALWGVEWQPPPESQGAESQDDPRTSGRPGGSALHCGCEARSNRATLRSGVLWMLPRSEIACRWRHRTCRFRPPVSFGSTHDHRRR